MRNTGCLVNADIFFVLDVSGSIGQTNFNKVKQFEIDFVKNITIGPNDNQVGTIIFNQNAYIAFNLSSYNDTESVVDAIEHIPYLSDWTNVEDALCRLKDGFNESNGARPLSHAVFRIAIVLTDGKSNRYHSDCNWDTIEDAAIEVHRHGILLYVIGVGDFDHSELEAIASAVPPESISYLPDFNKLDGEQETTFDDMCKTGKNMNWNNNFGTLVSKGCIIICPYTNLRFLF